MFLYGKTVGSLLWVGSWLVFRITGNYSPPCKIHTKDSEDVQFTLSASWTSQICSPVDGLHAGNTFPLTESCHSLLMKICRERTQLVKWFWQNGCKHGETGLGRDVALEREEEKRFLSPSSKLTTSDFKAVRQYLNWQVITRCFRPVVSFSWHPVGYGDMFAVKPSRIWENLWKSGLGFLPVQHGSLGSAPPSRQRGGWGQVGDGGGVRGAE